MLWRLSRPVHSFLVSAPAYRRCNSTAAATVPPLRILFCGSDDFSVASLRALTRAQKQEPSLIESIEVVHRPAKRFGRGLKQLREVPIQAAAAEESLVTHAVDDFTGWKPPSPYHLIVAVSFGLFIPPHVLFEAPFGGLNVHPSLLPDLKGAAPIQHAILNNRRRTGVSVQTLHPAAFDGGMVLAQTPAPGIAIPRDATTASLSAMLSGEGARLLVDVLKRRAFLPPRKDVGWYKDSDGPVHRARKLTSVDREVDTSMLTVAEVLRMKRAIGDPKLPLVSAQYLILNEIQRAKSTYHEMRDEEMWVGERPPGAKSNILLLRMACGGVLQVDTSTISGRPYGGGNQRMANQLDNVDGGDY